jgi:predicted enzyme related to lactoylglutathione lyase
MKRVVHFEIPSRDPKRTVKFYKDIFKWDITKWGWPEEYWSVVTWPKDEMWIDWWIEKSDNPWYNCVIDVEDIDVYTKKIIDWWWTLVKPKKPLKWEGWTAYLAYFKDTEGNYFWIIENKMDVDKK